MSFRDQTIDAFLQQLSSKAPIPGGGGASALVGALSASLAHMVAALTVGKPKYAAVEAEMNELLKTAETLTNRFLALMDEDAEAFEPLAQAYRLPKETEAEKAEKSLRMEAALKSAVQPPIAIMEACAQALPIIALCAEKGSIVAVSDACLMTAMPPGLTAATGLDALTHAVEAYVSTQATPVTDCKALKAIELIAKHLPTAVVDGQDLDAREGMVYAEYLAGIAFNNASLGYVHAAAHQLGGRYGLPHGLANALMLPAVTDFNLVAIPKRYADIARAMGQSIAGLSTADAARLAPAAMRSLIETLGTPQHLRDVRGFKEEDIPLLAAGALEDITGAANLRRATQEEMEAIFRAVL